MSSFDHIYLTGERELLILLVQHCLTTQIPKDIDIASRAKKSAIKRIKTMLAELTDRQRKDLVKYVLDYPPRARAFLGALLESIEIDQREALATLKRSLNPLSSYSVGATQDVLPNSKSWFIE